MNNSFGRECSRDNLLDGFWGQVFERESWNQLTSCCCLCNASPPHSVSWAARSDQTLFFAILKRGHRISDQPFFLAILKNFFHQMDWSKNLDLFNFLNTSPHYPEQGYFISWLISIKILAVFERYGEVFSCLAKLSLASFSLQRTRMLKCKGNAREVYSSLAGWNDPGKDNCV